MLLINPFDGQVANKDSENMPHPPKKTVPAADRRAPWGCIVGACSFLQECSRSWQLQVAQNQRVAQEAVQCSYTLYRPLCKLLRNDAAGDARTGISGGIGLHVVGFFMHDDRRATLDIANGRFLPGLNSRRDCAALP